MFPGDFCLFFWMADELRPQRSQQALADEVEIGRRADHEQAVDILFKAVVADLGETTV